MDVGIDRRVGRRLKNVSRPGSSLRSDPEPRQPEPPAETSSCVARLRKSGVQDASFGFAVQTDLGRQPRVWRLALGKMTADQQAESRQCARAP